MPCPDDVKTLLSRLVDGELSPEERAQAEAHAADCAPCRELLDLFRRNENLLAGALQTDAFGDAVIGSVVRAIRKEGPPEAAPVEDGPLEWIKARPWIPAAAGLLIALGTLFAVVLPQSSELGGLRRQTAELSKSSQDLTSMLVSMQSDHERTIREFRAREAFQGERQRTLGYHEDRGLAVRATFDGAGWERFELWRRGEDEKDFARLAGDLRQPEYVDRTAQPGRAYVYKFTARKAGTTTESSPLQLRLPLSGDLAPEQSLRIHCFDLAVTRDLGIFLIERTVNGKPLVEKFVVALGEAIGGPVEVAGAGRVDFSTGLTLAKIEEGHQTLPLSYAEPVLDEQGRPVVQRLENGLPVYLTRQHEVPLSIRPNLRAALKPSGPGAELPIFKGSWAGVRAR